MPIQVPPSLKAEHDELHAELKQATGSGGRTCAAASDVARLMHPHFVSEEEFALPPSDCCRSCPKESSVTK
jgi:hypothetical protein